MYDKLIIVLLITVLYVLPRPLLNLFEKLTGAIFSLDFKDGKKIAITIDDVPYRTNKNSHTDFSRLKNILDLADQYNIKLNLFVMGSKDNLSGMEINQLNRATKNHLLCNHGTYDSCHAKMNEYRLKKDLIECQNLIDDCYRYSGFPSPPRFYRPGCGMITPTVKQIANNLGMNMVLGTVYPHDPHVPFSYMNYLFIKWKLRHNDIVIIHDRTWSIRTMEYLFQYLNENHFETVTLDEMNKFNVKCEDEDIFYDVGLEDGVQDMKKPPRYISRRARHRRQKLKAMWIDKLVIGFCKRIFMVSFNLLKILWRMTVILFYMAHSMSKMIYLDVIVSELYDMAKPLGNYLFDWCILFYVMIMDYLPSFDFGDEIFAI